MEAPLTLDALPVTSSGSVAVAGEFHAGVAAGSSPFPAA
jgi:hypothetical protein